MAQINFAQACAEENVAATLPSIDEPPESQFSSETTALVEPSQLRTKQLGRAEWANILFAGITIAGGLFCAFYFFNGANLVRTALAWPGEFLYPRPIATGSHLETASSNAPAETALPVSPPQGRSSETRTGDPFSRTQKLISLDKSLGSLGYGGGLTAGTPPPFLPPAAFGSPAVPPVQGVPGLSGGSVGGLPGPGILISRLTLLRPGGDALTHALRKAAATVPGSLIVTMKDDGGGRH